MMLFESFIVRTSLAAVGVALAAAPLGCFVVWRRMAYVADAMAHAAILGVAVSLAFNISIFAGVLVLALLMAVALTRLGERGVGQDALLGVMAYGSLAAGLVALTLIGGTRVDPMAYLLGDIIATSATDLAVIWGGAACVVGVLVWRWNALLTTTLNPDLARASGLNPKREELLLILALAVVVAVSIKIVGALLIGALMIIPATAARLLTRTPESMALTAAAIGMGSAGLGFWLAMTYNIEPAPMIVCVAAAAFALATLTPKRN